MAIDFSRALGIHEDALMLRERRAELLANNLANADTPHFKARDLDFKSMLGDAMAGRSARLEAPRSGHLRAGPAGVDGELMYRIPMQPSLDGNTVDTDMEMANFARNALDFQASLTFLQSKLRGLKSAFRGE